MPKRPEASNVVHFAATRPILVAEVSEWLECNASFDRKTRVLEGTGLGDSVLMESPSFRLPPNVTLYFTLFVDTTVSCGLQLSLDSQFARVAQRAVICSGETVLSFRYLSERGGKFKLVLSGYQSCSAARVKVRLDRLEVRLIKNPSPDCTKGKASICLPHWTKGQRLVHSLCRRSPWINAAVATWEMHLGREELLSLPQYMAICPTGQCNASCEFCSVTTNRTGIIKKQLSLDSLDQFLSPVLGNLRLFGLEGNGEPTLYDHFDDLLLKATSGGSATYLITNAERLKPEQIALLLATSTDAINISLNAATAETHRRVMKLKGWDNVLRNISRLVRWRGEADTPLISVSMVVTRDNVHEIQHFLHLAEWQLQVDRILIRPLSEIANDAGSVEDLRRLVPFESQINDMLDSVAEYLEYVPRRAEVVIDPAAFNAFCQDPRGVTISPLGFENQLLAPRSTDWFAASNAIRMHWRLNRLEISAPKSKDTILARCGLIPVMVGRQMVFRCRVFNHLSAVQIAVVDISGKVLGSSSSIAMNTRQQIYLTVEFQAPVVGGVEIQLHSDGEAIETAIDFGKLYTWPAIETKEIRLPHSSRWQINMPNISTHWQGSELELEAAQPQPFLYLYRSYTVPTLLDEAVTLNLRVVMEQGSLGIGILSADGNEWLFTQRFESKGGHSTGITFNTSHHSGFQVVLYALTEASLHARIDWGDNLAPMPKHKTRSMDAIAEWSGSLKPNKTNTEDSWHDSLFDPRSEADLKETKIVEDCSVYRNQASKMEFSQSPSIWIRMANIYTRSGIMGVIRKGIYFIARRITSYVLLRRKEDLLLGWAFNELIKRRFPDVKIHCQMPWTNLNNFTVDGRMDVCCIATGPSQERYALGNIFQQNFQEIWNGDRMKEFRRTVNAADKLPPCARCPMANNYRAPF